MSVPSPHDEQRMLETIAAKLEEVSTRVGGMNMLLQQLLDARIVERLTRVEEQVVNLKAAPADNRAQFSMYLAAGIFVLDIITRLLHK